MHALSAYESCKFPQIFPRSQQRQQLACISKCNNVKDSPRKFHKCHSIKIVPNGLAASTKKAVNCSREHEELCFESFELNASDAILSSLYANCFHLERYEFVFYSTPCTASFYWAGICRSKELQFCELNCSSKLRISPSSALLESGVSHDSVFLFRRWRARSVFNTNK